MKWNGRITILVGALFFISCSGLTGKEKGFPQSYNVDFIPKAQQIEIKDDFFELTRTIVFFPSEFSLEANMALTDFFRMKLDVDETVKKSEAFILIEESDFEHANEYSLIVKKDSIVLKSNSKIGLLHGVSTLKQLLLLNEHAGKYFIPQLEIQDWPRFEHRGLLLDCSRHFFEKETILKYIDLLALYKMNALHWHLTEDQGWRIAIDKYPKLQSIASKRIELDGSEYGGIYSKADMQEVVAYALKNGIEVIPEIELPGHSQAAIAAYPHLSCTGKQVSVANDWGVFKEIYCAGNDSVFTFLEDVLTEVVDLFPSKYIHIGGDEAPKSRWEECSKCQNRIETEGLKNEHELQAYFIKRIQKFLNSKGKEIIGWDEILEGGLTEGAIVQSWRGFEGGIAAAKQGNKVIMSPTSHAYLDYDLKAINLEKIYSFNPIPTDLSSDFHANIIGGECNMWTEHVPDEQSLDYKVFPRLLGMAEVLWSDTAKNYKDFNRRVQSHYSILEHFSVGYGEETYPFTYSTFTRNDSLFVELQPASEDLKLTYQFYRGVRDNATKYSSPIAIDSNRSIHVQAFKNEKPYFCVIDFPVAKHKGLNAEVNYKSDYNKWYSAGGDSGLVDGKLGSFDFRDGNWQGFWGNDVDVSIKFKNLTVSNEIRINFYQYNNSWIFIPMEVAIQHSIDGITWNSFGSKIKPISDSKKRGKFIEELIVSSEEALEFNHLRFFVKNLGTVPNWHESAGSDAWIFMDEIQVK